MDKITISQPDDFHIHLRRGAMLVDVLPYTAGVFKRGLVMPNTDPPILTAEDAIKYRSEILDYCTGPSWGFESLMTIKITPQTTPDMIKEAKEAGVIAGKLYPDGVTTGSDDGVKDFRALHPVFKEMEEVRMVLSLHGEMPGSRIEHLDGEVGFLKVLHDIASSFPDLRVVMEHITTGASVDCITNYLPKNVAATITAHHLLLTIDDVVRCHINPHHFCKPLPKTVSDKAALVAAATSGNPKFFFGSDSAPHLRIHKECPKGLAGIFTAPVALPLLAEIFEKYGALDKLKDFVSRFGTEFYGLPPKEETITLVKEPMVVPNEICGIVPFWTGREISWRVEE